MPYGTPDSRRCAQQLDGAGQRPPLGQQLAEQLAVAALERSACSSARASAQLAGDRAREQPAAHADAAVDAPAVDRHAGLGERPLPGEDVGVDGVDERAVEVEDQRSHVSFHRSM